MNEVLRLTKKRSSFPKDVPYKYPYVFPTRWESEGLLPSIGLNI